MDAALAAAIEEWQLIDPDPETRAELASLVDAARSGDQEVEDDLRNRFAGQLEFGTAGLRGELGAGPNRMNRVVVQRAASAIGQFLLANRPRFWAERERPLVVIGFDGRVNSDVFARDSAEILAGLGLEVALFAAEVPTPVLAFTGKRMGSSASIMVTASHNPPRDNGYKVYLGGDNGGSQLISPDDRAIADLIASSALSDLPKLTHSSDFQTLGYPEIEAYVDRATELISASPENRAPRAALKICHTSLHGVGWQTVQALFQAAGFSDLHPVIEQMHPDGRFPTVSFPNPEEAGAMDLAYATATRLGADLILANDPDADRLAVVVADTESATGWRMLTGDQVGLILGWVIASSGHGEVLANSIVSSARLGKIATHFGSDYHQTLTGFKWISKVPGLKFGYEEALGYCVDPRHTPDKDGITAALLIAELAARSKAAGQSIQDLLTQIDQTVGAEATAQVSIRVTDLSIISGLMQRLRDNPPATLLGESVEFVDLKLGGALPPTDGLVLSTDSGLRVTVRPSGTEPKLKCYLSASGSDAAAAESRTTELRAAMQQLLN